MLYFQKFMMTGCHSIHAMYQTLSSIQCIVSPSSLWSLLYYFPAIPITFIQQLKNMQAEEGSNVLLRCELSKPGIPVEWSKGHKLLKNGVKYQIRKRETTLELLIWKPVSEDSGVYSCQCADQVTSANVNITGKI